jgi:hypothetical protein
MEEQTGVVKSAKCGNKECVFLAVNNLIENMKKEIVSSQNIPYHEQLVVAEIYYITASTLAEACRRFLRVEMKNCEDGEKRREPTATMDTFILLKQLKDDGLLTEAYEKELFDALVKMSPELEQKVMKDRETGIL